MRIHFSHLLIQILPFPWHTDPNAMRYAWIRIFGIVAARAQWHDIDAASATAKTMDGTRTKEYSRSFFPLASMRHAHAGLVHPRFKCIVTAIFGEL